MGRAARRQQARAERRQRTQPAPRGLPSAAPQQAAGVGGGRGSFFKPRWVMDIISELRKVTWPTQKEAVAGTVGVVIVVSVLTAGLSLVDLVLGQLVKLILPS